MEKLESEKQKESRKCTALVVILEGRLHRDDGRVLGHKK